MQYRMVTINTSHIGIEHVSNTLIAVGVGGFEVCDSEDFNEFLKSRTPAYDYVDEELMKLCKDRSCIIFYTADNEQGDDTVLLVEKALLELKSTDYTDDYGTLEISVATVDDSDWKDNWKRYYKPLEIGDRLVVVPAWENYETEKITLKIDPGMAFGTGSHETTSLCLEFLQNIDLKDKRVLDVGCGSGILSQAAVLLGAPSACGCDIDEAAVSCAVANAKLNNLTDSVRYYKGDLLDAVDGKYDVVIANIVADIIMALTKDIGKVITDNGVFIASGIIVERLDEVTDFISKHGFEIIEIKERRGWAAICATLK